MNDLEQLPASHGIRKWIEEELKLSLSDVTHYHFHRDLMIKPKDLNDKHPTPYREYMSCGVLDVVITTNNMTYFASFSEATGEKF